MKLYEKIKPSIVVAHECPSEVKRSVVTNTMKIRVTSKTEELLQNMIEIHRPDCFIFGHHHKKKEINIGGTEYVCLDSLSFGKYGDCIFEIPGITWE